MYSVGWRIKSFLGETSFRFKTAEQNLKT